MPPADGGPTLERRDARRARGLAGERDRQARRAAPPGPGPPPAEPHRIHERDPRSARAQHRRGDVPARRRLEPRLRQHGRHADDVAGADGGVSVGGRQDQPARARHRDRADARRVRRAARHLAERLHRRAAVRHARRHADRARVPGRRQLRVHRQRNDRLLHGRARQRQRRAARGHDRRRARVPVRLGQGDRAERRQRRPHAGDPDQGRLPPSRRHVHRDERLARHGAEQVVRAHDELAGLDLGLHVLPARRPGVHRRAVQRRRGDEHAEPRQDLRVLSRREQPRKSRVRAHDHLDAGGQSVPPPRDRCRPRRR